MLTPAPAWTLREKIRPTVTVGIGGSLALAVLATYLQTGASLGMDDTPMPFGKGTHAPYPRCEPSQYAEPMRYLCSVPRLP